MKNSLKLLLLFFSCQCSPVQKAKPVFNETVLAENKDVEVYISYRDTASIDQSDWIKFVIKNKSDHSIFITDASYSINEETTSSDGGKHVDRGKYGQANKYDLLHYYHDIRDVSVLRAGIEIMPNAELVSWKYLVNYAGVLIEPSNTPGNICPLFQANVSYVSTQESETLTNAGAGFCFFWQPAAEIPKEKLAGRLRDAMADVHFRWVYSYIISDLMRDPDVKKLISTGDLVAAILQREQRMPDAESILFLEELRARKAFPDPRLTEKYRLGLERSIHTDSNELVYYWDNSLIDDLFNSGTGINNIGRILVVYQVRFDG